MHAEPFDIAIPDHALDDLRRRLRARRPPLLTPAEPWQQGVDGAWLGELTDYWAERFDWRAVERALNRLPQFVADAGGQRVRFIHRRGAGPKPYPLVITHGWPGPCSNSPR